MLKHINFNRKIGQRTLDDDTLSNFIQNFEKIPLRNDKFEIRTCRRRCQKRIVGFTLRASYRRLLQQRSCRCRRAHILRRGLY